jgi:gamma-glutamyltranspeptidase/glutathione hydrolase
MADYLAEVRGLAEKVGGTTHISVIDGAGNAAALSISNGEGNGHILPGTGIMGNNMLGEEDLNPNGFFRWRTNARITSMMAPSMALLPDGGTLALGSGGSNRIRSALLQVLLNTLSLGQPLAEAVTAPRIHYERGLLNIEHGHRGDTEEALTAAFENTQTWPDKNFFFGGVHAVTHHAATAGFEAAGDRRRGGVALIVD